MAIPGCSGRRRGAFRTCAAAPSAADDPPAPPCGPRSAPPSLADGLPPPVAEAPETPPILTGKPPAAAPPATIEWNLDWTPDSSLAHVNSVPRYHTAQPPA